jgi:hypothetical protein
MRLRQAGLKPLFQAAQPASAAVKCAGCCGIQGPIVKHRGVDFDVEEEPPFWWRWKIYPKIEAGPIRPIVYLRPGIIIASVVGRFVRDF